MSIIEHLHCTLEPWARKKFWGNGCSGNGIRGKGAVGEPSVETGCLRGAAPPERVPRKRRRCDWRRCWQHARHGRPSSGFQDVDPLRTATLTTDNGRMSAPVRSRAHGKHLASPYLSRGDGEPPVVQVESERADAPAVQRYAPHRLSGVPHVPQRDLAVGGAAHLVISGARWQRWSPGSA